MSSQKLDYFYYKGQRQLQFTKVLINYDPETGSSETVYFVHAFGEGNHMEDVVLYRQFPKAGQSYYLMMNFDKFIESIHRVEFPVNPYIIGLKKESISIKQCPHIIIGIVVFVILIPILLLFEGGIYWLMIAAVIFGVWLYKSVKSLTVVRRTNGRRRY